MMKRLIRNSALVALTAASSACAQLPAAPTASAPKAVAAKAGAAKAAAGLIQVASTGRLHAKAVPITLQAEPAAKGRKLATAEAGAAFPYGITYVSQIPSPTIGGDPVQANDISTCGCGRAAIAYNTAGDLFAGAIQVVDMADRQHPAIVKEVRFAAADVNAVYTDGTTVWFGGQADPDRYPFKSFVGKFTINGATPATIAASMRPARSHTVTSLLKRGEMLYVGVGARDGGIEQRALDLSDRGFIGRSDVRSLADGGNRGVFALSGTTDDGRAQASLATVAADGDQVALGDFGSAYAKATVEVEDGLAFLGLSADGFQVRRAATGETLFHLPNPTAAPETATNGVSTDGDLAMVANGEYGFRVVSIADRNGHGAAFGSVAGRHEMTGPAYEGKRYSANLVRYRDGSLFVASGLGGVNVYALDQR